MKFLQDLIIAYLLPHKARQPVRFKLTAAQQQQVVEQCEELNSLIQEVHENLSDIRRAGSVTSQLTKKTQEHNIRGRNTLKQQQLECERINDGLRKISEEMRAVRRNVSISSQKTYLTHNRLKTLESKVDQVATQPSSEQSTRKKPMRSAQPAVQSSATVLDKHQSATVIPFPSPPIA